MYSFSSIIHLFVNSFHGVLINITIVILSVNSKKHQSSGKNLYKADFCTIHKCAHPQREARIILYVYYILFVIYNYAFKNSLLVLTFLFGSGRNNRKKKAIIRRIATTEPMPNEHAPVKSPAIL